MKKTSTKQAIEPQHAADLAEHNLSIEDRPLEVAAAPSAELIELAHAHGVATEYWVAAGARTDVSTATILATLAALDVQLATQNDVAQALHEIRERPWRDTVAPFIVAHPKVKTPVAVYLPEGLSVVVTLTELDPLGAPAAEARTLKRSGARAGSKLVQGRKLIRSHYPLPTDLELGYYALSVTGEGLDAHSTVMVTPVSVAEVLDERVAPGTRAWGFSAQLYAMRSEQSWGIGDTADLGELALWSAHRHGADFVQVSAVHAVAPVAPLEPNPLLPTSRIFRNPAYLRVEDIHEVAYLPSTDRAVVEWQAEAARVMNTSAGQIQWDEVWETKRHALAAVFALPRTAGRQASFEAFLTRGGRSLRDFATWCALAEQYGLPMSQWPPHAQDPDSPTVTALRTELAEQVEFYCWLQWCLDEQFERVQRQALQAGMRLGVMHELAPFCAAGGADDWAMAEVLARGAAAGSAPSADLPLGEVHLAHPWHPRYLAESGYAPFRELVRATLRHAGAVRIASFADLFRQWWVPAGLKAADGTYVSYDAQALLGILNLEAALAGVVLIGDATVPAQAEQLAEAGLVTTASVWQQRDEAGEPTPATQWPERVCATVTSGLFPPAAGYLAAEHLAIRHQLGLLRGSVEEELAADRARLEQVLQHLFSIGLLPDGADEATVISALYRYLTWTPARMLTVALADAVGDRRGPAQPGPAEYFGNWRLPLADSAGNPVLLENIFSSARVAQLAQAVATA